MRILIIIFLVLFSSNCLVRAQAQGFIRGAPANVVLEYKNIYNKDKKYNEEVIEIDLKKTKGSPYLDSTFNNGAIIIESKKEYINSLLRLNAFSNQIEIKDDNDSIFVLEKRVDYSCIIGKDYFRYFKIINEGEDGGYLREIHKNKVSLFKRHKTDYRPEQPAKSSLTQTIPARFNTFIEYFILQNNELIKIPSTKRKISNLFAPHDIKIKNYIKEKDLSKNKERDIIRIVAYYNSLIK